jgi:hypothetical protein
MAKLDKQDLKSMIKKSRVLMKGGELPKIHGYEGEAEELIIRQTGEVWTDRAGKEWKQVGLNTKVRTDTMFDKLRKELRNAPNCPKEICSCDTTQYLDKRMVAMKGMCYDCVQEHEQKLKDAGQYEDYEKNSMLNNEKSFLLDARQKLVESREYITKNPNFMNEDGSWEQWSLPNKKTILRDLEQNLEELETRLKEVEDELVQYEDMDFA